MKSYFLVFVLLITILAGCGYKGPLVMPPKPASHKVNASATTAVTPKPNASGVKINASAGVSKTGTIQQL